VVTRKQTDFRNCLTHIQRVVVECQEERSQHRTGLKHVFIGSRFFVSCKRKIKASEQSLNA